MKLPPIKSVPATLFAITLLLVGLFLALPRLFPAFNIFQRLEWMTYDWRVRLAYDRPGPVATNLGAVFITDESITSINEALGFNYPWPRQLYGGLVNELAAQGAKGVGFDIFFIDKFPNYTETRVRLPDGGALSSDEYFAQELKRAGNVVLGAPVENPTGKPPQIIPPAEIFRTNALAIGHAGTDTDSDDGLRRARPYKSDPTFGRVWHMGIVLAARELGLDLDQAEVKSDRIILRGPGGVERVIPLDENQFMFVDWSLAWNDKRILKEYAQDLLVASHERAQGKEVPSDWRGRLVVVGSTGSGNNISDIGPTPLGKTYLVSKHWNVANSVLTGRFIQRSSFFTELLLVVALGFIAVLLTWNLHAPWPTVTVLALAAAYVAGAVYLYLAHRYWLPMVMPVAGGLLLNHAVQVTYQVFFEQTEKRRVKDVFSKLVSPNIVGELLKSEKLDLQGSRMKITVFFADVRGFTTMTDEAQVKAEEHVRQHSLAGKNLEAYHNRHARETLGTVNIYLSTIADMVKKHDGTLDKYMGDCVMAFWGAPAAHDGHALNCVRAAIDAQRSMAEINRQRAEDNQRLEAENRRRAERGEPLLPLHTLLALGTGINTGWAIVGLMGSDKHILNYTVFGREVNIASRLEGVSGRGRIVIGEPTYHELQRLDPALAATVRELDPVLVKGIKDPLRVFEVPWKLPDESTMMLTKR
ncbi:MAG: adenylate/guanylate cyclase domain-containing protein [Verrucomicrobia bacterium]|nr:adenylate/guanylate cyclase domain-containing protein [Verrucomicrobiota bacterium]